VDQSPAEELVPQAVDHRAGKKWICRGGHQSGQVAARIVVATQWEVRSAERSWFHGAARARVNDLIIVVRKNRFAASGCCDGVEDRDRLPDQARC
jgi:hypothetical protein